MTTPAPVKRSNDTATDRKVHGNNAADPQDPALQGEGNYTAARRHRESLQNFIESGVVEDAAREAAPDSTEEARDMQNAEAEGLSQARR